MKMQFQTQYNSKKVPGEKNSGLSKTIPDRSLTVRELKHRHANGMALSLGQKPIFEGEDVGIPGWDKMDLIERQELAKEVMKNMRKHREEQYIEAQKKRDEHNKALFRMEWEKAQEAAKNASGDNPVKPE